MKKTTLTRAFCLLLPALLLFSVMGCSRKPSAAERERIHAIMTGVVTAADLPENMGATGTLTHRYRDAENRLPAGYAVVDGAIQYNEEKNTLTMVLRDADTRDTVAMEVGPGGTVLSRRTLVTGDVAVPSLAALSGSRVYWITAQFGAAWESQYTLHAMDLGSGEEKVSERIDELFLPGWFGDVYIQDLAADGDGCPVVLTEEEIGVFSPDLRFLGKTDASPDAFYTEELTTSADGRVCAVGLYLGEYSVKTLERDPVSLADAFSFAADWRGYGARQFVFTRSGELVWRDDHGVYVLRDGESVLLLDWQNSLLEGRDTLLCAAPDTETLFLGGRLYQYSDTSLGLWVPAPDLDLSTVRVIEMASTVQVPDFLAAAVVRFNRDRSDTRIALKDYHALYGGDAAQQLLDDILTGAYRPDLVVGKTGGADLDYFREHGMTLDLLPYLEADAELSPDSLLGCVRRVFSTEDGGLWAIPDDFTVRTLVAADETDPAADWSLEAFLDYADALEPGKILMGSLTRANAADRLLGQEGYGIFFSRGIGVCSFDNPLYLRWVNFVMSLPADAEELKASSALEQAGDQERYSYYRSGQVALSSLRLSDLSDILYPTFVFGTRGWDFVGYPTEDGARGSDLSCGTVFAVMSWAGEADAIWSLVRGVVTEEDGTGHRRHGFGILRSQLEEALAAAGNYDYYFYYSSDRGHGFAIKDPSRTAEDLDSPGEITDYLPEDGARLLDYLDRSAGEPPRQNVPQDLATLTSGSALVFGRPLSVSRFARLLWLGLAGRAAGLNIK